MGVNLGSAYGEIILDATGARTGIQEAQGALQGFQDKMANIGATLQGVGAKMTVGITAPLVLLGKKAISAGSDLTESMNKVEVVFGDAADSVLAWSTTTDTAMGQSQQQALEAAGTFGNLFDSLGLGDVAAAEMSMSLVGLASDLASFNNIDPTVALEKLRSGLVGEVEPLRVLGINLLQSSVQAKAMEMGLAGVASELTQADMLQARYALILEQSANAQGDFARTSDGLANSTRILKAQWEEASGALGQRMEPVLTLVVDKLSVLLEKFMLLPPSTQDTIVVIGALAAAAGPVLVVLGAMATAIGAIGAPLLLVGAAVALLGVAWATNFGGIRDVTGQVWESIKQAVQSAIEFVMPYIESFVATVKAWWDENWPAIQATFEQVWDAILSVVQYVVGLVGPFITETFGQVVAWVQANWPLIQQTIQTVLDAIWGVVQTVLGAIEQFWTDHGAKIMTVVNAAWEIVKTVITTALATIGDVIKAIMQAINGDWEGAWETIKGAAERVWEAIGTVIENAIEVVKTTVAVVWETIGPKLAEAWDNIKDKAEEIWEKIKDAIFDKIDDIRFEVTFRWEIIKNLLAKKLDEILGKVASVWDSIVAKIKGAWAGLQPVLDAIAGGIGWIIGAAQGAAQAIGAFLSKLAEAAKAVIPSWMQGHSPPPMANWLTAIGDAAEYAGTALSTTFAASVPSWQAGQIFEFVDSLRLLIDTWYDLFKNRREMKVLDQAMEMMRNWQEMGAGVKSAVEGLAAIMNYSGGLMAETVQAFADDTMMVINVLLDYVQQGVKRAVGIAQRFGETFELLTSSIEMLDRLSEYTSPATEQVTQFGEDVSQITAALIAVADSFDLQAVEAAAAFSQGAGQIGKSVGEAVGGLLDVAAYAGATPLAFMQLRNDLHTAVTMMERISAEFELEGVDAAAAFSESAGAISKALGDVVGGLSGLATYQGAGALDAFGHYGFSQLWAFERDLRQVLHVMQGLAKDFTGAGLDAAVTFAEAVNVIVDSVKDALKALLGIGEYEGLGSNLGAFITDLQSVIAELQALQGVLVDTSGLFAMTDSLFSSAPLAYNTLGSGVTVNVDAAAADPWAVAELTASALRTEIRYS